MSRKRGMLLLAVVVAGGTPATARGDVAAASGQLLDVVNYSSEPQWQTSFVNAAMCSGQATLQLEWNLGQTPPTNATSYQLFASNVQPVASATSGIVLCATADDAIASPGIRAGQIGSGTQATAVARNTNVGGVDAVRAAGFTCDAASEWQVFYICAHLLQGSTAVLSATGKFVLQTAAPDPPVDVKAINLQGTLEVMWTPAAGGLVEADHFVAFAAPVDADGQPLLGEVVRTGPVTRTGTVAVFPALVAGQRYRVTVVAYSIGGNPSSESAPAFATNIATYGGAPSVPLVHSKGGGCGTGGAGAVSLAALAALARLRRQRR